MATRYFCDRCGTECAQHTMERVDIGASVYSNLGVAAAPYVTVGEDRISSKHRRDLCTACVESLKLWLATKPPV